MPEDLQSQDLILSPKLIDFGGWEDPRRKLLESWKISLPVPTRYARVLTKYERHKDDGGTLYRAQPSYIYHVLRQPVTPDKDHADFRVQ